MIFDIFRTHWSAKAYKEAGNQLLDDARVGPALVDENRKIIDEKGAILFGRWPGNLDGINSRTYLLVPYRFNGDAHSTFAGSREYIAEVLAKVSSEYMNGCIQFVDDTVAQGL